MTLVLLCVYMCAQGVSLIIHKQSCNQFSSRACTLNIEHCTRFHHALALWTLSHCIINWQLSTWTFTQELYQGQLFLLGNIIQVHVEVDCCAIEFKVARCTLYHRRSEHTSRQSSVELYIYISFRTWYGSWPQLSTSSRTWEFVACFCTDRIISYHIMSRVQAATLLPS